MSSPSHMDPHNPIKNSSTSGSHTPTLTPPPPHDSIASNHSPQPPVTVRGLQPGMLRAVHHIALNVHHMEASCHFYGTVLGLHRLTGEEVPATLVQLVADGKVTNFRTLDGTILDLFWEPTFSPPDSDPSKGFTRTDHLAFDIAPEQMERAMQLLKAAKINFKGPIIRPTGKGIYFYDPDGLMIEVRCDPS